MEQLAKTIKDFGYQDISYKNMKVSDGWVVECKVDSLFTSLCHGNDILTTMNNVSNMVLKQILEKQNKKYRVKISNFSNEEYVRYFIDLHLNSLTYKAYISPKLFIILYLETKEDQEQFIKIFKNYLLNGSCLIVESLTNFVESTPKISLDEQSLYPEDFINYKINISYVKTDIETPTSEETTNTSIFKDVKVTYVKPDIEIPIQEEIKNTPLPERQQLYVTIPKSISEVNGLSSGTIFKFMMSGIYSKNSPYADHPYDVDDWERNRALLLCYPEWRKRLPEMSVISLKWSKLVHNWDTIEKLYNEDYIKYGDMAYGKGECDNYIRQLTK